MRGDSEEERENLEAEGAECGEARSACGPGAGASVGGDPGTEVVDWHEQFDGPVSLEIDQHSPGPVAVTGWDRGEVKVHAVKRVRGWGGRAAREILADAEVTVESSGSDVHVEARSHRPWDFWGAERVSVSIEAFVPRGSAVEIDAGSSRIEVRDTRGSVEIDSGSGGVTVVRATGPVKVEVGSGTASVEETEGDVEVDVGSGSVQVQRIKGSVEVDGSSGSVTLAEVEGRVEVDTASGPVRMNRIIGDISIDTGSGGVRLDTVRSRAITVDTGSGSIEADFEVLPSGRYVYDTGSGRIVLVVPDGASFTFSGESGSGRIDCTLPLSVSHSSRGSLQGVLGDGSAGIEAETSSGPLAIRTRSGSGGGFVAGGGGRWSGNRSAEWVPATEARAAVSRLKAENRSAVIKMVAEGKLTAAQGEALLRAMAGTEGPEPEKVAPAAGAQEEEKTVGAQEEEQAVGDKEEEKPVEVQEAGSGGEAEGTSRINDSGEGL